MQNIEIIKGYVESSEKFPIPFEDFWKWVGFSRKDSAKRTLENNFNKDIDFILHLLVENKPISKSNPIIINLTVDCAKSFAMLAQTQKGREVRQYFIECEKQLRQIQKSLSPAELILAQAQQLVEHEHRLARLEAKLTSQNEEYYTLAGYYRLNAWVWDLSSGQAISFGKKLKKLSEDLGYAVNKAYSEKFGYVNTYHTEILEHFFTSTKSIGKGGQI